MKNIAIIGLSVILAASSIFGIILYGQRNDSMDALRMSEKKAADLSEQVAELKQEIRHLGAQLQENRAQREKEANTAKARVSELQRSIDEKNQMLFEFEERTDGLHAALGVEKETVETLSHELEAKDAILVELKETLGAVRSQLASVEGQLTAGKDQIEVLQHRIRSLKNDKAAR
jgi:chromosome segregation ATPase